ncbi:MAG: beta-phosphoglucomutase [Ktedonobacterales bacterium]
MLPKPQAILFDLDGVLTDTSEYHYRAWKRLADEEGLPLTREENDTHLRGVDRRDSLMYLLRGRQVTEAQIQEMMDRKNNYYLDMIKNMTPNDLVPGGRALLQEIRAAGIKIAIASASKNSRTVLEHLGITSLLDGIADGYSVVHPKPAPDLFIYAAGLTGIPVDACLGIEDAAVGTQAIKAAGMVALGIGPQERFQFADKVMPTLAGAHLADMLA